jgi:predicted  nucleic acid-binding Zn ribbon protein
MKLLQYVMKRFLYPLKLQHGRCLQIKEDKQFNLCQLLSLQGLYLVKELRKVAEVKTLYYLYVGKLYQVHQA